MKDACALCGVGLIGGGCWLICPPLAMVVVGVILLAGGVAGHLWSQGESVDDSESSIQA